MFGYAQPHEIDAHGATSADYERWRRTRCAVCRAMGQRYGHLARFGLTVDAVFLALVLDRHRIDIDSMPTARHCLRHDVARTDAAKRAHLPFELGAIANGLALSVGLDDHAVDERGFRRAAARAARWAMGGAHLRERTERDARAIDLDPAQLHRHVADITDAESGGEVAAMEAWLEPVGDATGATFETAERARQRSEDREDAHAIRVMRELGSALGHVVLLLDAVDDADADARRGRPNALRALLGCEGTTVPLVPLATRAAGCALALREIERARIALAELDGDVRVPRLILTALGARVARRQAWLERHATDPTDATHATDSAHSTDPTHATDRAETATATASSLARAASLAPLTTLADESGGGVPWGIVIAAGLGLFFVVACCSDTSRSRQLKDTRKGRRAAGTATAGPGCACD